MGDLDPAWTESTILSIWSSCGEKPVSITLIPDRTNLGRGPYCFVAFADAASAELALEKNATPIPGTNKTFKLNWSSGLGRLGGNSNYNLGNPSGTNNTNNNNNFSLFVGDIALDVTEEMLLAEFKKYFPTEISLVKIMMDTVTRQPKGFGFVRFTSMDAQHRALKEMNGAKVGSRNIRVGLAAGSSHATPTTSTHAPSSDQVLPSKSHITLIQPQPKLAPHTDPWNCEILVSGLAPHISLAQVLSMFIGFGDIIDWQFCHESGTARIKYCFRHSAETAMIYMHGSNYGRCQLRVKWAGTGSSTVSAKPLLFPVYGQSPFPVAWNSMQDHQVKMYEPSERCLAATIDERVAEWRFNREKVLCEF